jgi:ribulose-phosphate 3-epimerase
MIEIIPAIMPHDMNMFREQAQTVSRFSSIAQLDVMDGKFVPGVSWPFDNNDPIELTEFPVPSLVWEAHLMIENPHEVGVQFAAIGAERIVGHIEAFGAETVAREALQAWRAAGARKVGISLLLDTPLESITPLVDSGDADYVQVMGIATIGVQGSDFDERTYKRVRTLRQKYPDLHIAIDGGVDENNARELIDAGATRLAVGSGIWKTEDPAAAYRALLAIANEQK